MSHLVFTQNLEGFFNTSEAREGGESSLSSKLSRDDVSAITPRLKESRDFIHKGLDEGKYPFLSLVGDDPDKDGLFKEVQSFKDRFDTVLILGTGGSSLGGQSLVALKNGGVGLPLLKPRQYFLDNVDPETFELLLPQLDLKNTGYLIISKSGETTETLTQVFFLHEVMKKMGLEAVFSKNACVITQFQESPLYRFSLEHKLRLLPHDAKVGGRFSVFSLVGLFPLLLANMDLKN